MSEESKTLDDDIDGDIIRMHSSNVVKLNVGGSKYITTKTTLCKSSYFAGLLSGKFRVDSDGDGNIFIDRNGIYFGYILEYLRSGISN